MQAFQPRPIQLPGGDSPVFSSSGGNPPDWSKLMRIGLILGLVIIVIIIISAGKSYSVRQHSVTQNQDIRPLGYVHNDNVQVTMPTASEIVRLPLFIQGTARLEWFSDGIFPIEIRDGKNNVLASTYAIADIIDQDTQTANFRAVVEGFDMAPATRIGRVVLYRQVLRNKPDGSDIASIGVDFSSLAGSAWVGKKTTTPTTAPTRTDSGSVWTDSTTTKSTTTVEKKSPYSPYEKYGKVIGGPFTCANGIDDDRDGQTDADDPSCHTDGYPANDRTYDGDLDEAKRAPTERDADGNLPGQKPPSTPGSNTGNYSNGTVWQGNAKIRVQPLE